MIRRMVVTVLALVFCLTLLATPRRAAASDNLEYIIPAAVGGAVALILIVAILMADSDDDEYGLAEGALPELPRRPGLKLAHECAPTAAGRPLLCW
ncbi:MAG: hypothetical protein AB7V27_02075 [Candidatus Binatia bacterium]